MTADEQPTFPNEIYLGDGLYFSVQHGMIFLRAGDHYVGLERNVLMAFLGFVFKTLSPDDLRIVRALAWLPPG